MLPLHAIPQITPLVTSLRTLHRTMKFLPSDNTGNFQLNNVHSTHFVSPSKLPCDFYSEGVDLDTSQASAAPTGGLKGPLHSLQTDAEVMPLMETRILLFFIHFP
jgi:hypothetical protein